MRPRLLSRPSRRLAGALLGAAAPRFAAVVLAALAGALWLLAAGLDRARAPYRTVLSNRFIARTSPPVSYHTRLPRLGSARAENTAGWRMVVRVDSLPPVDAGRLCVALRQAEPPLRVVALALADAPAACVRAAGIPVLQVRAEHRPGVRDELRGARWVVIDRASGAFYSARSVPSATELRGLARLLARAEAVRSRQAVR